MISVCVVMMMVSLGLFLHPYTSYPLSLRLFSAVPVRRDPAAPHHKVSTVFSAYNEERSLPAKIENLRQIKALYPDLEILAYSDCSSDNTLPLLQSHSDLLTVIPSFERAGKATGMRKMVAAAHGDIVIFTDANVILEPESVGKIVSYFSDPKVGGVAGSLHYINEGDSPTAKVGGVYWRLEEHIKQLESRCGSIMGADGSIFATRRSLYPEVPPHLLDDLTVSLSVTFHGMRLIHATDVLAFEKNTTASSDEFRRKRRIACRAFNTHRFLWPKIRQHYTLSDLYKYVSHKVLRWFGLVPLTLAAGFGAAALMLAGLWHLVFVLGGFGLVAYVLGRRGIPVFSLMSELLLSIVATFYGIMDSFDGKTYQTWAPAVSRN